MVWMWMIGIRGFDFFLIDMEIAIFHFIFEEHSGTKYVNKSYNPNQIKISV